MTRPRPWRPAGIRHRMSAAALTHLRHAVLLAALCALTGLAAPGLPPPALAQPDQFQPDQPLPDQAQPEQAPSGSGSPAGPAALSPAHRGDPGPAVSPAHPRKAPAGEPVLVIATCDWPPYAERHLPHGGYVVQIIRAALASAGLEARFEFMPWARGMALLREGQVAAVAPAYKTTGRESECDLSAPFPGGPLALFALAGNARRWTDLRDLADLRIGVVRGYAHTDAFDEAPFLTKEAANDETANLRKLMAGRIDAMAADRNVVHYRLRRDLSGDPATLAEFDPVLGERDLYVCFSRTRPGHAALRAAFDKGLATVRAAGLVDELYREMRLLTGEQPAGQ
ncbi:substrate-binding periplasmic protein [Nitratidesulfovibrio sp. 1201_IL3209]|uniref:substrate-binding periplasmic protein n=1 Tax=Nitratidesulfovibrio sp. 1201_IL3209 TaxID=3084053 RepID=UPI002FDAE3F9